MWEVIQFIQLHETHGMIYINKKNYIRDTCGKSFTPSCTLKQHEIKHVRKRTFVKHVESRSDY